jgi:hypothetical protein
LVDVAVAHGLSIIKATSAPSFPLFVQGAKTAPREYHEFATTEVRVMNNGVASLNLSALRINPLHAALSLLLPLACASALAQGADPAPQRWQFHLSPSAMPRYEPLLGAPTQRVAITGWAFTSPRSALGLSFDVSSPSGTGLMPSLRAQAVSR